MHRPIDTLYYQWALSEEDKTLPGIFEEVASRGDDAKLNDLLAVFAHMTVDVMESEIAHTALIEDYADKAEVDEELLQSASPDDIVDTIEQFPDVLEAQEAVAKSAKRLDLFQAQLVKALMSDEV